MATITAKYKILERKGEGTFSEVLICQNKSDGKLYALKKMKQRYNSIDEVNDLQEIQALRQLPPHPNILKVFEIVFDQKTGIMGIISELMEMNMYEMIRGRTTYISEVKVKRYMFQLCKAVAHIHRYGIFHRDIKPENILIKDEELKLADFGSCRTIENHPPYTEYISTRWYRAPECLLTNGFYSMKMDIWSMGCVFFEILSLRPLFPGSNEVDQINKIHEIMGSPNPSTLNKFKNLSPGINFNFPIKIGYGIQKLIPYASKPAVELINAMCAYDPDRRILSRQALRHAYFKDLRDAEKRAAAGIRRESLSHPQSSDERRLSFTTADLNSMHVSSPNKQIIHRKMKKRRNIRVNTMPENVNQDGLFPKLGSGVKDQWSLFSNPSFPNSIPFPRINENPDVIPSSQKLSKGRSKNDMHKQSDWTTKERVYLPPLYQP